MQNISKQKGEYTISTDSTKIDLHIVHQFLSQQSYWSKNIPIDTVEKSITHSLNFGLFYNEHQIGYARVISDYATIAYLGDVFILPEHRGKGLSKWLIAEVMEHPALQGLRRWILLTGDAHELYKKYGWKLASQPEKWMELHNPNVYK